IIYAKRGIEVIPNRELTISMNLFNLVYEGYSGSQLDPNVRIELVDGSGNVISDFSTGNISRNQNENDWRHYSTTLDPANNTNIDIVIRTHIDDTHGNDLAIDDIQAFQIPEVCPGSFTVDVNVEDGHAFDAALTGHTNISCFEGNDGSISFEVENFDPAIGYTYQIDGEAVSAAQFGSTVSIPHLEAGTRTITLVDLRDPMNCTVVLEQELLQPDLLVVMASGDHVLTCNDGATITASVTGGTASFEYQLEDAVGAVVVAFQPSAIFHNVNEGEYTIRVMDNNGCGAETTVTVDPPATIVFEVLPSTCMIGNNEGTIVVTVTSGNGNY